MRSSFGKVFMGAAGTSGEALDDEFNRVSFLSHFEGANNGVNNAFDDGSANNHTITAAGDVTQGSFGPFARPEGEWGWSFDGDGDSLTFTNDATMSLDGDYTFELFFNARTIVIDTQHPNTWLSGTTQLFIHASDRYVSWYAGGADIVKSADDSILTNVWNHVAVVRSGTGSNNTSLYLNGTRVAQTQNTATLGAGSGTARIGSYSAAGGNFNGHISNIRILKGTALYSGSSITVPTSKLTAVTNTKLLTCQSNRFIDNSSTGFALTPVGNAAVTAFGPFLTSSVYDAAVNGASAYFDGNGDYLSMDGPGTLGASANWCMECFFYCNDNDPGIVRIMSVNEATDADAFTLMRIRNNKYEFYSGGGSSYAYSNQIGTANYNEWAHIALTKSGTTVRAFVNGIKLWEATHNATNVIAKLITGWGYGSEHFPGYISDARFVNGSSVYTGNFTPPTAPLTAITNTSQLLNMANGQAIDSAAQNNLTLVGDAKISNTQAKFGDTSIYFDGTGDEAKYFSNGFGTGDFTMEAWVYPQTQPQRYPAVYYVTNGSSDRVAVQFDHDSNPNKFRCTVAGTVLSPTGTNAEDQWYHTAVVRYQGVVTFYIDGTSVGSTAYTHNVGPETAFFGGNTPISAELNFKGFIDDFRVSNTARYTANFTPPTEPFADKGE